VRVAVPAVGSRGDVEPFLAPAAGLPAAPDGVAAAVDLLEARS
jgi:hypothetical protein